MKCGQAGEISLPVCVCGEMYECKRLTVEGQYNYPTKKKAENWLEMAWAHWGKEFGGVKIIVCVDNRMGMCFNQRRVSRDRVVSWDILKKVRGNVLWMAPGTEKLFEDLDMPEDGESVMVKVDVDFLEKAEESDYCLAERESLSGYEEKFTQIILYRWNRDYPADLFFEIDLGNWKLKERKEFAGYSHEKITREIYSRQG